MPENARFGTQNFQKFLRVIPPTPMAGGGDRARGRKRSLSQDTDLYVPQCWRKIDIHVDQPPSGSSRDQFATLLLNVHPVYLAFVSCRHAYRGFQFLSNVVCRFRFVWVAATLQFRADVVLSSHLVTLAFRRRIQILLLTYLLTYTTATVSRQHSEFPFYAWIYSVVRQSV